jgi:hypothetical protein
MSSAKRSSPNYSVGYKKPPKSTRFQPGRSGNPAGRPKGSLSAQSIFDKVINERVTINEKVNERSRRRSMTMLELAFRRLAHKSASGSERATDQLIKLLVKYDTRIARPADAAAEAKTPTPEALASLTDEELQFLVKILEKLGLGPDPDTPREHNL